MFFSSASVFLWGLSVFNGNLCEKIISNRTDLFVFYNNRILIKIKLLLH